jgi:hypothetical protein
VRRICSIYSANIKRKREEFLPRETRETTHTFRVFKTLNNFFPLCLVRWEKCLQCDKALSSLRVVVLSLFREREKKRALGKKRQFLFVVLVVLCIRSRFFFVSQYREREHMKASSSKSQETDFASPLSERQQKQRTLGELRFRFRASALKQSPSSDALLHDGEEEDFLEEDQLARYVEPPELPTLAMHKVFGTFLLEAFSYMRNV